MNAEILAVGTELLMGQIVNTNAQYITKKLQEFGINVFYHTVVGDNPTRLKECLEIALNRCDIVFMTGGLGPTKDDLTKETVAEYFKLSMKKDEKTVSDLNEFFSKNNRQMTENNLRQANFPEGATILYNDYGTAPGCIVEKNGKIVVLMPGPPIEMQPMFENGVLPYLKNKSGDEIFSKFIRIFGVGESKAETMIMDLVDNQENPTIATYCKLGEVTIRVTAKAKDEQQAYELMAPVLEKLRDRFGNSFFSDADEELQQVVVRKCLKQGIKLAFAESCTGGMISSTIVDVPGSSEVLERGIVTYSNEAKVDELGVLVETLNMYGAVSENTAAEMAEGLLKKTGIDIAVSVTGVAGPGGGTPEKPVGTIFVGVATNEKTQVFHLNLDGNRQKIRTLTMKNVFKILIDLL